jgi:hypothetical protein
MAFPTSCALALALTFATCAASRASPVTNWIIDHSAPPAGQTLVTSGLNTSSPILGTTDPTRPDNADATDFHAAFPEVRLPIDGDFVLLTGRVTLSGIDSSERNFRFGLFDQDGNPGTTGWLGYFVGNSGATSYGEIRQRDAGNSDLHVSVTGSTEITRTTSPGNSSTGDAFIDDSYYFQLQLTRDGSNYDITSVLSQFEGTAFNDVMRVNDQVPAATDAFRFNNVAFLLGDGLNTDRAAFSNIDVVFFPAPEPSAIALLAVGNLLLAGRRWGRGLERPAV